VAGLALDSVLELAIVLADGDVVHVDPLAEPDLFWATRGGGNNFGVITRMQVRLHPVAQVVAGVIGFDLEGAGAVLREYTAAMETAPDELTVAISVATGTLGGPVLFRWPTWSGPADSATDWMARLRGLGRPILSHLAPMSYGSALKQLDPYIVRGRHYEMSTRNLPTLTPDAIDVVLNAGSSRTSDFSGISIHHFHGAAT
jgi:FAD/FMN-containing dehydrogenase